MRRHSIDIVLSIVLFAAALLVIWPRLMLLPAFGDESLEVLWGFDIATGKRLIALTGHDPYYGPIFPYLMAAGFRLFGVHLIVPRAIVAVCAALTVPVTFWFGRLVENRWAGVVAAVMVCTCPSLVLYSHYGWSNSLTPFFATLSFACLYFAVERGHRGALAAAGFLVALTVQTHPLTSVAFAGAAVWLIQSRTRHPWLTWRELRTPALLCALGYSPILLENIIRPLITWRVALIRTYAFVPTANPHEYLARLIDLGRTFLDMFAGGLAFDRFPAPFVGVTLAGLLLAGAIARDTIRGNRLFSCSMITTALIMPVFVKLYSPRYISFLVPIAFVAASATIVHTIRDAMAEKTAASSQRIAQLSGAALAVVALVVAQASSFRSMARYNAWGFANGMTNEAYSGLVGTIQGRHVCGPQLLVEDVGFPFPNPAWVGLYAIDYILTLGGCEHRLLTAEKTLTTLAGTGDAWAVMSNATGSGWPRAWHLQPVVQLAAPTGPNLIPITLYHVTRADAP